MAISYSDGSEIEARILRLVRKAGNITSNDLPGWEEYREWAVRYHLCPERANLVRHLNFEGLDVLELGAGMGGVSRHLAENAKSLYVVEGTDQRFEVLNERLRDLDNWDGAVGNFQQVKVDRKFDVVCLIGVLEYSELYMTPEAGESPFETTLKLARSYLRPGGALVLAIENRFGLKYWAGCAEDHTARLFDGIAGYPLVKSPKTFSRSQLLQMMMATGFGQLDEYYPFPDYKVPTSVLSKEFLEAQPEAASALVSTQPFQHYGMPPVRILPCPLVARNLAHSALLRDFVNSFLMVASDSDSPIREKLLARTREGEQAWHYAFQRRIPTQTTFSRKAGQYLVQKEAVGEKSSEKKLGDGAFSFDWTPTSEELVTGVSLRFILSNHLYFSQWEEFENRFRHFLKWSFKKWRVGYDHLMDGGGIDAILVNACEDENEYALFDLEWKLRQAFPKSWFIFRNVFNLSRDEELFSSAAPFASFRELYERMCRALDVEPQFEEDVERESQTQAITGFHSDPEHHKKLLLGLFSRAFPAQPLPRDTVREGNLRSEYNRLREENAYFHEHMGKLPHRLARKSMVVAARFPRVSSFFSTPVEWLYQKAKSTKGIIRDWQIQRKGFLVSPGEVTKGKLEFTLSSPSVEYPQGFFVVKVRGDRNRVREGKFIANFFDDESVERQVSVPLDVKSSNGNAIIRLGLDVSKIRVRFSLEGEGTPVSVSMKQLPRWKVALYLLGPILWGLCRKPSEIPDFLRRGVRYVRAAGHAGLRFWIREAGLQTFFQNVDDYLAWIQNCDTLSQVEREQYRAQGREFSHAPLFSFVMPTYNTEEVWLRKVIESVRTQLYTNWELCIADDASTSPRVREVLEEYRKLDPRILVTYRATNGHISRASNTAIGMASGEYIVLVDHDDELSEMALYRVVEAINKHPNGKLFYSDEDKIDIHGRRHSPHFKPEWDSELFHSLNLVTHLSVFKTQLIRDVGGFREGYEGSQDYDLTLRCVARLSPEEIVHIPYILYHWRTIPGSVALGPGEKNYAHDRARKAIKESIEESQKISVEVVPALGSLHRVKYPLPSPSPRVSVIVCTRDRVDLLKVCLEGVLEGTEYDNIEVVLVDNGSEQEETKSYLRTLEKDDRVTLLREPGPFNYSALNNHAAQVARGEILLFLNNDIEVLEPDWMTDMVSYACREDVGAVGVKLLYPDETIQHAGISLGVHGVADHGMRGLDNRENGYFGRAHVIRSVSAVSAACMAVRASVFKRVGGFDEENLKVAYNDVDLCLRIGQLGLKVVQNSHVTLVHHESASRGSEEGSETQFRFAEETRYMKRRWREVLRRDPFYSPNLSLETTGFNYAIPTRLSDYTPMAKPSRASAEKDSHVSLDA